MIDPLGALTQVTEIKDLEPWNSTTCPFYDVMVEEGAEKKCSPFKCDDAINRKICLWSGDISALGSEAIIHPTNEAMSDQNPQSVKILSTGGPDLVKDIKANVRAFKTGEARLTRGYCLPSRYIIHTVGPRYNIKYRTAAESALFNSYRNVLFMAREHNIRSLGMSCIHTLRRGYPALEGAHIAIRTVRRFLEKFSSEIDLIIFVVQGDNEEVYNSLMPLYFPRTQEEEDFSAYHLPEDVGNEDGEPVIEERKIRISGIPTIETAQKAKSDAELEESVTISEAFQTSVAVGCHGFSQMESDFDRERKQRLHNFSRKYMFTNSRNERYTRWLKSAKLTDHSSMHALRCLYQSGFDKHGRPVIIFLARNFPAASVDLEKAILFFIHVMDSIVDNSFVFVYFNSMTSKDNHTSVEFIKDLYQILDGRYSENLRSLFIVHPTVWSKMLTWWTTTFSLSAFKAKIHNIPGLEYLYSRISPDQLDLPPYVLEHDLKVCGTRYYDPDADENIGAFYEDQRALLPEEVPPIPLMLRDEA